MSRGNLNLNCRNRSVHCCFKMFEDSSTMNQIMSQPVISTETVDDDELRQELDDLLAAKVDSNISATPLRPPADGFGKRKCYFVGTAYLFPTEWPLSWKVTKFGKTIFQAWNVMENNIGHGESWKMIVKSLNFYAQMINCNVKPNADNYFQQVADYLSWTVADQ